MKPDYTFQNHLRLLIVSSAVLVVVETDPIALHNGRRERLRIAQSCLLLHLIRHYRRSRATVSRSDCKTGSKRGFPQIAHEPGFIEPDRPLYVKVFHFAKIRKCPRVLSCHLYLHDAK